MIIQENSNRVEVNVNNLWTVDVQKLNTISYKTIENYPDFISMMEMFISEESGVDREIHDEISYELAIAELDTIIKRGKKKVNIVEEVLAGNTTIISNQEGFNMKNIIKNNKVVETVNAMKVDLTTGARVTGEEFIKEADDSLVTLNAALKSSLDALDNLTGFVSLKDELVAIIKETENMGSIAGIFHIAKRCREKVDEEIQFIMECGDTKYFKDAIALKQIFYVEDEITGDRIADSENHKTIFEAFASGVCWLFNLVKAKVASILDYKGENELIKSICSAISTFIGLANAAFQFAVTGVKFAASFVAGIGLKIIKIICDAIKTVINKIKAWTTKKNETIIVTAEDITDIDTDGDNILE